MHEHVLHVNLLIVDNSKSQKVLNDFEQIMSKCSLLCTAIICLLLLDKKECKYFHIDFNISTFYGLDWIHISIFYRFSNSIA